MDTLGLRVPIWNLRDFCTWRFCAPCNNILSAVSTWAANVVVTDGAPLTYYCPQ